MTWPDTFPPDFEYRTLVLAPTGNDARLTVEFLGVAGMAAEITASVNELGENIAAGCGAVIIAEEVLSPSSAARLFGLLKEQPTWSDVPIILITTGGTTGADRARQLTAAGAAGNVSILERPFRLTTLNSVVETALRARRRQYQVRKLLNELDQARQSAEQASRAKDDFLAALSHELRTPLNPVLLLATEYAGDHSLPEGLRKDFEQIARNINLEARLIDDLLDLTRITRGKLTLDLRPWDAHEVMRQALATTLTETTEKQLVITLDLGAPRSIVKVDAVRLQQILWNVLKNSAKFTPVGGRIRIESFNDGDHLVLRITDSGVGMDAEELARVFEAFAQGNHARPHSAHRFGGLGLGLAICRMLVTAQGGTITAASDGPGLGASFTVKLPVCAANPAPAFTTVKPGNGAPHTAGVARVLLVEDHEQTRLSLAKLLERRGFSVAAAGSLMEARKLIEHACFDLLISDLGLPDGNGYELMAELRGTPLKGIALSGYGMESDVELSLQSGFTHHLTKPVNIQALDAVLATCR